MVGCLYNLKTVKSAYTVLEGIVRGLLICLLNDGFTAFCILCINVE